MKLVKATEYDSEKLSEFLKNSPYPGILKFKIQRPHGFFAPYRLQSQDFVTYYLLDKTNKIQAMASLLFKKVQLFGEEVTIGYATDLRVGSQKAVLGWTQHFLPALEKEREERNCQYIFSTVNKFQNEAYKSFLRPRSTRKVMPRYYLFRNFEVVSIHGMLPLSPSPLKTIEIRKARSEDLHLLQEYIERKQQGRPISEHTKSHDLMYLFEQWPQFNLDNFLIAFDMRKKIVGCLALWDGNPVQSFVPQKWNQKSATFRQTLKFLSLLGLAKSFGPRTEPLNMIQMNHIYVNNPDVFNSLVKKAWSLIPKNHFLVYVHFTSELATHVPRSYITTKTDYGLYCVLTPKDPIPDFLKPIYLGAPPDFEFAYI